MASYIIAAEFPHVWPANPVQGVSILEFACFEEPGRGGVGSGGAISRNTEIRDSCGDSKRLRLVLIVREPQLRVRQALRRTVRLVLATKHKTGPDRVDQSRSEDMAVLRGPGLHACVLLCVRGLGEPRR